MKFWLTIFQILISICLTGLIILQAKGTGLGSSFGPSSFSTKRGVEKTIFWITVILAIFFALSSILQTVIF